MTKSKRVSLAVKINIMIMALVLSVSVLLILISENTYQKAVFQPYFRKLENTEIPVEELTPTIQEFRPYLGTEELNRIVSESDVAKRNLALGDWFLAHPGLQEPPLDTMMDDWMDLELKLFDIQRIDDLQEISCYEEKNGIRYFVCSIRDNDDFVKESTFSYFGMQLPEGGPAENDYLSPKYMQENGKTLLIRFILLDTADDGQTWIRMYFDLTEEIREHGYFLLRCVLLTLVVTFLASVITGLVMRRYVLQPVRSLAQATRDFVPEEDGTYSPEKISRVEIRNHDEIGDLSHDIRTMQESIVTNTKNLARMTAERERVATELALAAQIQADALPNVFPAFPEHKEFDIFASMTPAKAVGGDFYDFFLIDETHLGIVMADVSGKDVPAALFMMSAKSLLRTYAMTGLRPAQVLHEVNNRLCENNRQKMFVTIWFGVLDFSTGHVTSVNAGHEYPALNPSGKHFDLFREKSGFLVGAMKGMRYRELEFDLTPGARIFLYTDGIPEASDAGRNMFGEKRMIDALNEAPDVPPEELLANVRKAVDDFVKEAPQFDDLTMLCLDYKGPAVS